MRCKHCGEASYSDVCPSCKKKGPVEKSDAQKWHDTVLNDPEFQEYLSSEISEAYEAVFQYSYEITTKEERRKFFYLRFGQRLSIAINQGLIPDYFKFKLKEAKERNIQKGGDGSELLKSLGLIKPRDTELQFDKSEDVPF